MSNRGNNLTIRNAFTLVELLIVMAVLTLLAAVTLPTVKDLLADQKSSQGARLVQGFLESARARAIGTGRPVAVIIERMYVDGSRGLAANDTSTRLSIGEVFPPYEGDWSLAEATIKGTPGSAGGRGSQYAEIDFSHAASLWDAGAGAPSGLIQAGDLISFGNSRRLFRITGPVSIAGTSLQIPFDNPEYDEDHGVAIKEPAVLPDLPVRFRVYRKPSKSLAGSVTLPRGICIDLSSSGLGQSGLQFSTEYIAASNRPGDPAVATPTGGSFGPVYIVFDTVGKVQDLYFGLTPNDPTALTVRRPVSDTVHLLIGKTEQVAPSASTYLAPIVPPASGDTDRDDVRYNILDPSNYWVSVFPFSGAITSSQVQSQSAFATLDASFTAAERASLRIARARSLASSGNQRTDP